MTWTCPVCNNELGELNGYCEYCKQNNITTYNPDRYYVRDIRIPHIIASEASKMTPQEELFAELFNKHINILHPLVKDMDLLEIRAYRERMSLIALEGRAAKYAADEAEKEVLKTHRDSNKPTGFEKSLNADEASSAAINTIKERQKRLTKNEKLHVSIKKLFEMKGTSSEEANKLANEMMKNGSIVARLKDKENATKALAEPMPEKENKSFFNPFEKKEE